MRIFEYDSPLSRMLRCCYGCLFLSLLWLLCCIPLVTVGAGSAAVYYTMEKNVIREECSFLSCFWKSFRENFKTATVAWLLFLGLGLFLGWDFYFFYQLLLRGNSEGMLCVVIGILLLLLLLTVTYAFAYVARFRDRPLRAVRNAFLLMLVHPLVNLKILFLELMVFVSFAYQPILLLVLPGICSWLFSRSFEKIFARLGEHQAHPAKE